MGEFNIAKYVSERVSQLPDSDFPEIIRLAEEGGRELISLGPGEPDFDTPEPILRAGVESLQRGETHYTSNSGLMELRRAIAEHLDRLYGQTYNPASEVLITVGVSEALYLACAATLDPGDEVIIPGPCFVSYGPEVTFAGGKPVMVPAAAENHWQVTAEAIEAAGTDLGLRWYGARALMSLRLEKGWGAWMLDYRPDFTAAESGLDIFIDWDKEFIGKAAALEERERGPQSRLVTLVVAADDIDVCNDEAILDGGEAVGYVSSGGYAHHVQKSVALGYVPTALAGDGQQLTVEINGEMFSAEVQGQPLYDSNGGRMRS